MFDVFRSLLLQKRKPFLLPWHHYGQRTGWPAGKSLRAGQARV